MDPCGLRPKEGKRSARHQQSNTPKEATYVPEHFSTLPIRFPGGKNQQILRDMTVVREQRAVPRSKRFSGGFREGKCHLRYDNEHDVYGEHIRRNDTSIQIIEEYPQM